MTESPLEETELRMAAEITMEMAKDRDPSFDPEAAALALCEAALAHPAFRDRLAEVHRRLDIHRSSKAPRHFLTPIAPLLRELEQDAELILGRV